MVEFAYNNAKNTSTGHTLFELNCGYHPRILYRDDINPRSKSKSADKLSAKLRELIIICQKNLHHAQELQKQANDKATKPKSYVPSNKVWLNSKYIKIKWNWKLEVKFFRPFRVLYPVGKQAYKLELFRKWKIHYVFHKSLLEHNTTKKKCVNKEVRQMEFNTGNNSGEYKVETIRNNTVYARESKGHLPGLYYLVSWKEYLEEENTWEPASAVQQLRKLISSFHKDYLDKPIATSEAIDTAPSMAKPTIKSTAMKQNQSRPANSTNKQAKNWAAFDFYYVFEQIWVTSTFNILSRIPHDCMSPHVTSNQPSLRILPFNF